MTFTFSDKIKSREQTLISVYRDNFGYSLPYGKQYWTLCGLCYSQGSILSDCEFDHVVKDKLIEPRQFFGVDNNEHIINDNKKLNSGNFINGDFYSILSSQVGFNPGIVNFDCLRTFETEKKEIKKIFSLLQPYSNLLFNINVLIRSRWIEDRNSDEMVNFIAQDDDMSYYMQNNGWEHNISCYKYRGMSPSTIMASIGLIKN